MPGAQIVANQPTGAGAGTPGVARNDLWQAQQINLLDAAGGNGSWQWTLLSKPTGSAASLAGDTTAAASFTPDLIGTYRVQLVTNGGGPGNVSIKVLRVRFSSAGVMQQRGWALPAFGEVSGESNFVGNAIAWAESLEFIFSDIRAQLQGVRTYPGVAGRHTISGSGSEIYTDLGAIVVDASVFAGTCLFRAVMEVSVGVTAEVRLFNLTSGAAVTGSVLTSSSTVPATLASGTLVVGGAGNLTSGLATYLVQARIIVPASPGGGDSMTVKLAQMEVTT